MAQEHGVKGKSLCDTLKHSEKKCVFWKSRFSRVSTRRRSSLTEVHISDATAKACAFSTIRDSHQDAQTHSEVMSAKWGTFCVHSSNGSLVSVLRPPSRRNRLNLTGAQACSIDLLRPCILSSKRTSVFALAAATAAFFSPKCFLK